MDQFHALALLEPGSGYFHSRVDGFNQIYRRLYDCRSNAAPPFSLVIQYATLSRRASCARSQAVTADSADVDYQLGLANGANDVVSKLRRKPVEVDPDRGRVNVDVAVAILYRASSTRLTS